MSRNILIFSPTGIMSKQLGLTTEILEELKSAGDKLTIVRCKSVLHNCYGNRVKNPLACASCQSRMDYMLDLIDIGNECQQSLRYFNKVDKLSFPYFSSLEQLLDYEYQGINVGRAVASSIISYFRDYSITNKQSQVLIDLELRKAVNVILNFREIIKDGHFDELYLFNGRFAEVYPVMEVAKQYHIPFKTIEAGAGNRYAYFENALPHSIKERQRQINILWKQGEESNRQTIGKKWFEDKRKGSGKLEIAYTKSQQENLLPQGFDPKKKNIAIFNSSEDELKAIVEWRTSLFLHQNEAIVRIAEHFKGDEGIVFYLRVHPNLKNLDNTQTRELYKLNYKNLHVIRAEEKIDTYALMDACNMTISFGSTMGIESTFWGNVSVLFGKGFYQGMNCAYEPKSFDELFDLINSASDILPKPKTNTIKYGYYWSVYGCSPKKFNYNGLRNSYYNGKKIPIYTFPTVKYAYFLFQHFSSWKKLYQLINQKKLKIQNIFSYK